MFTQREFNLMLLEARQTAQNYWREFMETFTASRTNGMDRAEIVSALNAAMKEVSSGEVHSQERR